MGSLKAPATKQWLRAETTVLRRQTLGFGALKDQQTSDVVPETEYWLKNRVKCLLVKLGFTSSNS